MSFAAFWLPGSVPQTATREFRVGGGPSVNLQIPLLTPELVSSQIDALLVARETYLKGLPVAEIVRTIARVAERFADPEDPLRKTASRLLPAVTGFSAQMVEVVLNRMSADWMGSRLDSALIRDLGDPRVLDGFGSATMEGPRTFAVGPRLSFHVFSGNVPGVSVTSLIRTLLTKSATFGKTASGEPILAPLFAQGLSEADAALARCLAVAYWTGGNESIEPILLSKADAVIGYGSASTIESLRSRTPATTRFLAYGNRISFAVVTREALTADDGCQVARDAAQAVAMFDQQGCVSPQSIYVEEGGEVSPRDWTMALAAEMEKLEESLPRGSITREEAAAILQARGEAEFARFAGATAEIHISRRETSWTVIFDPESGLRPSCLNRTVRVIPIGRLEEVADEVGSFGDLLQTVGVAGDPARLEKLVHSLAELGVTRVTPLAEMPWPPPSWRHDGRPAIGDLLKWCDWE